jgi:hypothetical protein
MSETDISKILEALKLRSSHYFLEFKRQRGRELQI